jgi:RNA polymerase sigma-70 factor, ECF subfamily
MRSADAQSVVFTEYAKSCIRVKARQLSRQSGFCRSDEGDLEQELWLTLLKEAKRFDPQRASLNTFTDRIVRTAAGMIVRGRHRQKRAAGNRAVSLDQPKTSVSGGAKLPLLHRISDADLSRRIGIVPGNGTISRQDAQAVATALDNMPDDTRDVCRHVMGGNISSAARDLGRSRRQIREALLAARPYFERAGFSDQ